MESLCTDENIGNIIMGNDEKIKVQEFAIACLKFHDDTIKNINVRYVIDASKNVLSLSVLASRRYMVFEGGRSCKVYKEKGLIL